MYIRLKFINFNVNVSSCDFHNSKGNLMIADKREFKICMEKK